jgi:hypothetical protein
LALGGAGRGNSRSTRFDKMTASPGYGNLRPVLSKIGEFVSKGLIFLITAYRYGISPLLGQHCRYSPSCSEYAMGAVSRHGAYLGTGLAVKRLCRCHPWGPGGYDPVP